MLFSSSTADFSAPCGSGSARWPIRTFAFFDHDVNVNTHHGGGAGLALFSNAYGGKPQETTAQLGLVRFGFDGNHFGWKSIRASKEGHFRADDNLVTDESGNLVADLLFGHNHVMLLTNVSKYGNLNHGIVAYCDDGNAG